MNNIDAERDYLERELGRYYPDATVKVTFNDDETIDAVFDYGDDCSSSYTMTIHSDDDCYDFVDHLGAHITVPFRPEDRYEKLTADIPKEDR